MTSSSILVVSSHSTHPSRLVTPHLSFNSPIYFSTRTDSCQFLDFLLLILKFIMLMEVDMEKSPGIPDPAQVKPMEKLPSKTKKFKDFSLIKKNLFTTITEQQLAQFLRSTPDGSPPQREEVPMTSSFVQAAITESQKSGTQGGAACFSTAGDPRVDFFFKVTEQTNINELVPLLKNSWASHPTHTLRLIAALRDIKGGKGIRSQYHECLYWLYQNNPKVLYENLEELLKFGYWKDALQFLMVIFFKGYIHPHLDKDDAGAGHKQRQPRRRQNRIFKKENVKVKGTEFPLLVEKEAYNNLVMKHFGFTHRNVKNRFQKNMMHNLRIQLARERFFKDKKYQIFHIKIAQIFAKQLQVDLIELRKPGDIKNISLAAKWAPSLEGHFDRYTLIGSTVALELVKLSQGGEQFVEEIMTKPLPIAVYLSRKYYQKQFCLPLRESIDLPEIQISAGHWDQVNYERVPSKCLQRNSKLFEKHDRKRFQEFLKKSEKVAGSTLKPMEIINRAMNLDLTCGDDQIEKLLVEKQWTSLVEDIKRKGGGLLQNAVALCDLSPDGLSKKAAMGLTLITMSLSSPPWNTSCMSFQKSPKFHEIPSHLSLTDKVAALSLLPRNSYSNLQEVFRQILSVAIKNGLKQEEMPRVLFVFTNMEFTQAFRDGKEKEPERIEGMNLTNFEAAKKLFKEKGFELPAIIFWNLSSSSGSKSTPVQKNDLGVILLAGFSAQQLTYVIKQTDLSKCTPLHIVLDVVESAKYQNLNVFL